MLQQAEKWTLVFWLCQRGMCMESGNKESNSGKAVYSHLFIVLDKWGEFHLHLVVGTMNNADLICLFEMMVRKPEFDRLCNYYGPFVDVSIALFSKRNWPLIL